MSLILRTVCSLARVVGKVYVLETSHCGESAARDVESEIAGRELRPEIVWVNSPASIPTDAGLFVVHAAGVFDHRLCSALEAAAKGADIVRCQRPGENSTVLWFAGRQAARDLVRELAMSPSPVLPLNGQGRVVRDVNPERAVCEPVSDERTRRAAERKLFFGTRKESDSLVARHFDRYISGWFSRRLVNLPVTPNQVTIASTALGLVGVGFLLAGTYGRQLFGSVLLVLAVILDGCDGELARVKFMESSLGRRLDYVLDNIVNALAIFATGAGYFFQHGEMRYLYISLYNMVAAAAVAVPVYFLFFRRNQPAIDPHRPPVAGARFGAQSVVETVNGRDFAYLIFFLALVGKAHWFALMCMCGLTVFVVMVLFLCAAKLLGRGDPAAAPTT